MKGFHGELPVCRRCCFCFPLRMGLLVIGYTKLTLGVLMLYPITVMLIMYYAFGFFHNAQYIMDSIQILGLVAGLLMDICFNIVLIVAAHTKNQGLLKYYNRYALFVLITTSILLVALVGVYIFKYNNGYYVRHTNSIYVILGLGSCHFLLQFYLILMIRSEALKLSGNSSFRFVNNAADAECTFVAEDVVEPQESDDTKKVVEVQ